MLRLILISMFLLCCVLPFCVGCASRPASVQVEGNKAEDKAMKAYFDFNSSQTRILSEGCEIILAAKEQDIPVLVKATKGFLDSGCEQGLSQMETIYGIWDKASSQSAYYKDSPPTLELAEYYSLRTKGGFDLVDAVGAECIKKCMWQLEYLGGRSINGFDDLSNYYEIYKQIYHVVLTPNGSLMSYKKAADDFRLQATKLSNRLNNIIQ